MPFPPNYQPTKRGAALKDALADARWVIDNAQDTIHATHKVLLIALLVRRSGPFATAPLTADLPRRRQSIKTHCPMWTMGCITQKVYTLSSSHSP